MVVRISSVSFLGLVFVVSVYLLGGGISVALHLSYFISFLFPVGLCLCLISEPLGFGLNFFDLLDWASSFVDIVLGLLSDLVYDMYDLLDLAYSFGVDFLKRMAWRFFVG